MVTSIYQDFSKNFAILNEIPGANNLPKYIIFKTNTLVTKL